MPDRPSRRAALKALAVVGVAPTVAEAAWLHPLVPRQPGDTRWRPRFFTEAELAAAEVVAELIIPETDTPGARAALAHQYIDWRLSEAAPDSRVPVLVREGLAWLDRESQGAFVERSSAEQTALLTRLAADPPTEPEQAVDFFREFRRLTISGYYRSEVGMQEEIGYAGKQYLTEFEGCTHEHHLDWTPPRRDV